MRASDITFTYICCILHGVYVFVQSITGWEIAANFSFSCNMYMLAYHKYGVYVFVHTITVVLFLVCEHELC